jgi:hypothetical protein
LEHSWKKLTQFDEKNTLIPGFHIEGFSHANYRLKEYFISLNWRKNTLRSWLFYQVEPYFVTP